MNLTEAKELLMQNGISYEQKEECDITTLVIYSNNGHRNIELLFNKERGDNLFEDLYFGDFDFELFDSRAGDLSVSLNDYITSIMRGTLVCMVTRNLKKGRLFSMRCFDLDDDDRIFGKPGYDAAMQRIQKPKSFIPKLRHAKMQYEVYDWDSYSCIIK